jgi:hypothetical protein
MEGSNMDLEERIELITKYVDECTKNVPYGYGYHPSELLETCNQLKVLGYKWGDRIRKDDFRMTKGFCITNSSTKYESDKDTYYVHWDNGNVGAYQFVSGTEEYSAIQDEFKEFKDKLMSYGVVDWDDMNDHIVFDVEHGKKVMEEYDSILKETKEKMSIKLKQLKAERAKKEYERAMAALEQ